MMLPRGAPLCRLGHSAGLARVRTRAHAHPLNACHRALASISTHAGRRREPSHGVSIKPQLVLSSQPLSPAALRRLFTTGSQQPSKSRNGKRTLAVAPTILVLGALLIYSLYPAQHATPPPSPTANRLGQEQLQAVRNDGTPPSDSSPPPQQAAWTSFANKFESFSNVTDIEWSSLSDRIVDVILPNWSKMLPAHIRKLQRELSMAPGSLADDIWREAHDPFINPEIQYSAKVRVSDELCDEEKEFRARRKKVATAALAHYLDIDEKDIHPDDVPTIAMCGSGGGLRALVAGTGSLLATQEDGLFDCVTYTSGVSGSCWLQSLYHSSISNNRLERIIDHMKARIGTHIAYPPVAFSSVTTAPTNRYLLSGVVEKLKGDPNAEFGLVDVYGILLAARLLVPKGELQVNDHDFKLSNQREYIKYGQSPMPIYTAVRHEIPDQGGSPSEQAKEIAKQEAWFQWFEMSPYEFFCEEFNAGIPTWAMGRRFNGGVDVAPEHGFHLPEIRLPLLMGIFGSAFCATLSHYYREIRPLVRSLTGFGAIDEMINTRSDDLEKVHPIDPALIPNFAYNMEGQLRFTAPTQVYKEEYIQLMDAGMSNNLPIYPLLRPGREVDVLVAFDASADVKTDNWLSVADGYARQRGIKGWPVGVGWPKSDDAPRKVEEQLDAAQADTTADATRKLHEAQAQPHHEHAAEGKDEARRNMSHPETSDLGYCTIWVGTTEERSSEPPPPSKALHGRDKGDDESWHLMRPDAGIAVVYLPFLANPKVEGVDPAESDYMSTWNFVYTPEQIDRVVELARANYDEGRDRIRACVRAVYERKRRAREQREQAEQQRRLVRLGMAPDKLGGDVSETVGREASKP